jgi:hypothetical protein
MSGAEEIDLYRFDDDGCPPPREPEVVSLPSVEGTAFVGHTGVSGVVKAEGPDPLEAWEADGGAPGRLL